MKISLVTGSLFRRAPLERLLDSLVVQRHKEIQLILVEQGDFQAAQALVADRPTLEAVVVPSACGLSRARNVGMRHADGDIIGFPDDDCWYVPGTLSRVAHRFQSDPDLAVLCGRVLTPSGPMLRYPADARPIDRSNVWRTVVSPGLFMRRDAAHAVGEFDEALGVGAGTPAGSGEETDYVLRALALGRHAEYDPLLHVSHPSPEDVPGRLAPSLGYGYGVGMGRVLGSHRYSLAAKGIALARPAIGAGVARLRGDGELAAFRRAVARGRLAGMRGVPE